MENQGIEAIEKDPGRLPRVDCGGGGWIGAVPCRKCRCEGIEEPCLRDYLLRVGRYRVLFNYDGAVQIVTIEEVRKRDEQTY